MTGKKGKIEYVDMGGHRWSAVIWSDGPGPGQLWVIPDHGVRRFILVSPNPRALNIFTEITP